MAFRLELSDLPPRYRAQAEAQLAKGRKKRSDPLAEAARAAKITGKEFDSLGEYEYYIGTVAPKVARGEIVEWEAHPCFPLFPAGQCGALKLRPVRYTADFRLVYAGPGGAAGGGGVGRPRRARAYIISAEKFCAGSGMVLGLCLPPAGTDFRRGEPPETGPKGSFLNRLYARRVQVSTKRGKAVEKQFANMKAGG